MEEISSPDIILLDSITTTTPRKTIVGLLQINHLTTPCIGSPSCHPNDLKLLWSVVKYFLNTKSTAHVQHSLIKISDDELNDLNEFISKTSIGSDIITSFMTNIELIKLSDLYQSMSIYMDDKRLFIKWLDTDSTKAEKNFEIINQQSAGYIQIEEDFIMLHIGMLVPIDYRVDRTCLRKYTDDGVCRYATSNEICMFNLLSFYSNTFYEFNNCTLVLDLFSYIKLKKYDINTMKYLVAYDQTFFPLKYKKLFNKNLDRGDIQWLIEESNQYRATNTIQNVTQYNIKESPRPKRAHSTDSSKIRKTSTSTKSSNYHTQSSSTFHSGNRTTTEMKVEDEFQETEVIIPNDILLKAIKNGNVISTLTYDIGCALNDKNLKSSSGEIERAIQSSLIQVNNGNISDLINIKESLRILINTKQIKLTSTKSTIKHEQQQPENNQLVADQMLIKLQEYKLTIERFLGVVQMFKIGYDVNIICERTGVQQDAATFIQSKLDQTTMEAIYDGLTRHYGARMPIKPAVLSKLVGFFLKGKTIAYINQKYKYPADVLLGIKRNLLSNLDETDDGCQISTRLKLAATYIQLGLSVSDISHLVGIRTSALTQYFRQKEKELTKKFELENIIEYDAKAFIYVQETNETTVKSPQDPPHTKDFLNIFYLHFKPIFDELKVIQISLESKTSPVYLRKRNLSTKTRNFQEQAELFSIEPFVVNNVNTDDLTSNVRVSTRDEDSTITIKVEPALIEENKIELSPIPPVNIESILNNITKANPLENDLINNQRRLSSRLKHRITATIIDNFSSSIQTPQTRLTRKRINKNS
ncbi:unnamed protein product, partial [Didymodactylos carnosus]